MLDVIKIYTVYAKGSIIKYTNVSSIEKWDIDDDFFEISGPGESYIIRKSDIEYISIEYEEVT